MTPPQKFTCDFKLFGNINKSVYRLYAERYGRTFGIRGWIMPSLYGSVQGQMEGTKLQLDKMKKWLEKRNRVSHFKLTIFSEYKNIPDYTYRAFYVA